MLIPENVKSRIYPNGRLRMQLKGMKQVLKENPDSEYAKKTLGFFKQKYWLGSTRIKYSNIFDEAWLKIIPDYNNEIIDLCGYKFIKDNAFKAEYTDIYIAAGKIDQNANQEIKIAYKILSLLSVEGPYENEFVEIEKNDIVVDAGANMGLFSIYCVQKGVKKIFAFEPQIETIKLLEKNILLNNMKDIVELIPLGLYNKNEERFLSHSEAGHAAASIIINRNENNDSEIINCVALDSWVKKNKIPKIDFIKADIEGAERNMLEGAIEILKKYEPKLAICTYHFPDDPKVLKDIILKANPNYVIRQTSHKLFAYVPQQ